MKIKFDAIFRETVLHAFGSCLHAGPNVHLRQTQRHCAGINGGEIENIVDECEQGVRRSGYVAEVLGLLFVERPKCWIAKQVREPNDVRQRRA